MTDERVSGHQGEYPPAHYSEITLGSLADVDPRALMDLMNDPDIRRFMPLARGWFGPDEHARFIAEKSAMWARHGYGPWAFLLGEEFIGWGGLQPEDRDFDIGLVLQRRHWGAGRTLYERILDYAFTTLAAESVTALLPTSRSRVAGLHRLGFHSDGYIVIGGERFARYRLMRNARRPTASANL